MAFTDISLWAFTFALFCCYHTLKTLYTLETSAVMWSLRTSLQPVLILDKYHGHSWAHLNSLHLSFHKKIILGKLFCPFLSWQKDLNEKSHKGTLLGKAAKQREFICFRYSPAPFTHYFFLTFTYFQSPDLSGSHV